MKTERVPDGVRRFLLGAIASVPHLEALLLLHGEPETEWTGVAMAKRLFISEGRAEAILLDLRQQALLAESSPGIFQYAPAEQERNTIEQLVQYYSRNIVEVASLLHAKLERQALEFSEAFRLKKEP